MVGLFLVVGGTAMFTEAFSTMLPSPRNYLFGGVLLLYGFVRVSRLMRQLNADKRQEK